jgi:hypothetical protein
MRIWDYFFLKFPCEESRVPCSRASRSLFQAMGIAAQALTR